MNLSPTIDLALNKSEPNLISNVNIEKSSTDSAHPTHVNIRFTVALAVPAESPTPNSTTQSPTINHGNRQTPETSKIQGYYRIEYSLIPGEPNIGFDVAVYRTVAKIYPDNQDSQLALTWEDNNDNVWIIWSHLHQLELTRERLLALLSHKIVLKIWDGKEFCSVKTRLDKPRLGRALPNLISDSDEDNSTKSIVETIAQNYADKWISKPMLYKLQRKLPIQIPTPSEFLQRKIEQTGDTRVSTPISLNILEEKPNENSSEKDTIVNNETTANPEQNSIIGILKTSPDENALTTPDSVKRKRGAKSNKLLEEKKEKGTAQIIVPNNLIFAGFKIITCRLDENPSLPKTIQDCFVHISIEDHQLLTETLANEFNPLTITISHIENLPSTPVSYPELRQRCEPVYCSYQLFDQPIHQTERRLQAKHIYWNDLNLYFLNLIDKNLLGEFRNSPIINIEIHDRDERISSRRSIGSVFGSENTDEIIGRVSSKMNLLKPKAESDWHPHGCAKLDLSEFWLGQTSLEFYIPVVPCHAPESVSRRGTASKRLESQRIQQGDYLSNGTQIQIIVKLAKTLLSSVENRILDNRQISTPIVTPFTRIVFVFSYKNTKFLTALETCIRMINAKALDFDQHPAHVQIAALSTYKLTETQQASHTLNIITGFHLFDDEQHLFILEGRKEDAIDVLYKQLPKPEGQNVEILYDSSIRFNERLYVKLGVDITHIKLRRTLHDIVSQPLIFVRDTLPKETFDALDKLHQLVHVHKLSSSARYNLFPTIEMMTSLNRDFGIPLSENEIKLFSSDDRSPSASSNGEKNSKDRTNYSTNNKQLKQQEILLSDENKREEINFLERNIERVRMASLRNKEIRKDDDDQFVFMTIGPVYPYSTQKFNASENALEQMRTYLKQNHPSSTCSYNPNYRSGTFSPYSNDETVFDYHEKLRSPSPTNLPSKLKEKSNWITYSGHRSSRESNTHPKSLDPARLEELSKPPEEWYEQSIHSHQSPVIPREPFKWLNRKEDFDRWTRTSPTVRSISAHWQSPDEMKKNFSSSSTSTLIVADERMHFLRRSPHTEMIDNGRLCATQLDRLTGLLKDKPIKKGLLLPKSYSRTDRTQSAPLTHKRSLTNTPDRRIRSTTSMAFQ